MDATPEGDMAIGLALAVEAIGIGEFGLVTVRRADPGNDYLTRTDALVAEHRLSCRHAGHSFHWRVITQGLLHGTRNQRALFAHASNYARIRVEAENHIA